MAFRLTTPVGKGGNNTNPADNAWVQMMLNKFIVPGCLGSLKPLTPDGIIGPKTIAAIKQFQRDIVGFQRPDGRVDPGGATLAALDGPVRWPRASKVSLWEHTHDVRAGKWDRTDYDVGIGGRDPTNFRRARQSQGRGLGFCRTGRQGRFDQKDADGDSFVNRTSTRRAIMSIEFSSMTIDGSDLQLLALDVLASGNNPSVDPAIVRQRIQERLAKAEGVKQRYEVAVRNLLRDINSRDTGRAVFEEIRRETKTWCDITIKPWLGDPDLEEAIEAAKAILEKDPSQAAFYTPVIRQMEKEAMVPNAFADSLGTGPGKRQVGREGRREAALVRFTPANWPDGSANAKRRDSDKAKLGIGVSYAGPGSTPDEMLLHELVHALRIIAGLLRSNRKVPFQKQYDDMEEFFAILIVNIYRSECKRPNRRAGHDGYFWFKSADPKAFLNEGMNRMHVRQLRFQHPSLFNRLNDLDVGFNPLRGFRDAR